MIKPNYLINSKKISFVAPSFGCTTEPYHTRLLDSIGLLTKEGYDIRIGKNCFKDEGIAASNTPKKRAKEFIDAWKSDTDAIISVGGGETMIEILEYINFPALRKYKPKWFMGYSDNTNLTYTLTVNNDIETIYGPNAPSFQVIDTDSLDALRMLKGETHFKGYGKWQSEKHPEVKGYVLDMETKIIPYFYEKPVEGILLGGCLDCLANICGTKFDKTKQFIKRHKDQKIIFYLEACDLTSIGIRRALFNLKNAGWFSNVSMFIIGRSFLYNDESFGTTPEQSYYDLLKSFNVPILLNCDLGHLGPSMPIRNGATATVEYKDNNLIIDYKD